MPERARDCREKQNHLCLSNSSLEIVRKQVKMWLYRLQCPRKWKSRVYSRSKSVQEHQEVLDSAKECCRISNGACEYARNILLHRTLVFLDFIQVYPIIFLGFTWPGEGRSNTIYYMTSAWPMSNFVSQIYCHGTLTKLCCSIVHFQRFCVFL